MNDWDGVLARALEVSAKAHADHTRKGSEIPYIVHPFEVAMILQENGMTEEVIAAGLLHDILEDTSLTETDIKDKFGQSILDLVIGASEKLTDREKRSWKERKEHTVYYLDQEASFTIKCVSCADKLSNARSIVRDLKSIEDEQQFWNRFNAGRENQKWYYKSLVNSLRELEGLQMYRELEKTVESLF